MQEIRNPQDRRIQKSRHPKTRQSPQTEKSINPKFKSEESKQQRKYLKKDLQIKKPHNCKTDQSQDLKNDKLTHRTIRDHLNRKIG